MVQLLADIFVVKKGRTWKDLHIRLCCDQYSIHAHVAGYLAPFLPK